MHLKLCNGGSNNRNSDPQVNQPIVEYANAGVVSNVSGMFPNMSNHGR